MSNRLPLPVEDEQTEIGSYFVATYPPFSTWSTAAVERDAKPALHAPPAPGVPLGMYLHIPFCRKRCHFCYFRVYTDKNAQDVADYLDVLALRSGELAADAIVEGLAAGDTSAAQLSKWGPPFNEGVDRMRRLVCEYYDGFSFGSMVRRYPHLQGTLTDLLIGDLFTDRVDQVWGPLESLYPSGKPPVPRWDAGRSAGSVPDKANELVLPDGRQP